MDDPWGSPWADEAPQTLPLSKPSAEAVQLSTDNPLAVQNVILPGWGDDDDGFGEWAAAPEAEIEHDGPSDSPESNATNVSRISRPSTSLSEHSQHEAVAESPRTSFEDDNKRPTIERQGSSKVKELVQLFDGLAVPATESGTLQEETDEKAKDEDFAHHVSDEEAAEFEDFTTEKFETEPDRNATDRVAHEIEDLQSTAIASDHGATPAQVESLTHQEHSESIPVTHEKVDFMIDVSTIDDLFDKDVSKIVVSNEEATLSDLERIQDAFTTIDERKVWYRISRYGTMRKHNSGDEDYVRINWLNSKIREDTLKIVSKWREADRISGVTVLGVTNRSGGMFGWGDTTTAPLPLESVFPLKHTKRLSSTIDPPKPFVQDAASNSQAIDGAGVLRHQWGELVKPEEKIVEPATQDSTPPSKHTDGFGSFPQQWQSTVKLEENNMETPINIEDDEIVDNIVKHLPDFSYMLRP